MGLPVAFLVILVVGSAKTQTIQYIYDAVPTHAPYLDSFYSYSYDKNGNLNTITNRYTGVVKQRLEYNSLNKLLRATAGTSVTEYRYDANGSRIEKIGPAGTEKYYGLIEAKGNTKTYYYFLGSRRVAQRTIGGNLYFHQQDHLGSASVVTDQNGTVVSRNSYHEFGSIKWQEGAGGISDYTYNDKRWDKETNFYDYGARAYNAKMFKFTTPDSIVPDPKNPQSLNRYAYVKNNPLTYIDPTGHADRNANDYQFPIYLGQNTWDLGIIWMGHKISHAQYYQLMEFYHGHHPAERPGIGWAPPPNFPRDLAGLAGALLGYLDSKVDAVLGQGASEGISLSLAFAGIPEGAGGKVIGGASRFLQRSGTKLFSWEERGQILQLAAREAVSAKQNERVLNVFLKANAKTVDKDGYLYAGLALDSKGRITEINWGLMPDLSDEAAQAVKEGGLFRVDASFRLNPETGAFSVGGIQSRIPAGASTDFTDTLNRVETIFWSAAQRDYPIR
ncbi:MAG TPA: RHS repeat-associated core domain-containing protein [Bdellovibrionota bacterium]|nr:RHS repeat-associated core domain-containing protein [Bdellovibrionota bacterium]